MIGAIGNAGQHPHPPQRPLSDEQRSSLEDILSKYDPSSKNESDVASLREELRDSGIGPSAEVKGLLEDAGFDVEQLRPNGPPPGRPPDVRPPHGAGMSQGLSEVMSSFIEQYENGELTEDDVAQFVDHLKDAGFGGQGLLLDTEG